MTCASEQQKARDDSIIVKRAERLARIAEAHQNFRTGRNRITPTDCCFARLIMVGLSRLALEASEQRLRKSIYEQSPARELHLADMPALAHMIVTAGSDDALAHLQAPTTDTARTDISQTLAQELRNEL